MTRSPLQSAPLPFRAPSGAIRAFRCDPRVRDSCAELLRRQGAPDHAIVDDEGRRSPDAEYIGADGVPHDQRIQGGILHVAREPLGFEAGGAGAA